MGKMPQMNPSISPAEAVPGMDDLYEQLGFHRDPAKTELATALHDWRENYTCEDSTPGPYLTSWTSLKTQKGLRQMALDFLEHVENGRGFWPSHDSASLPDALEYYAHREEIVALLVQLFWHQNMNDNRTSSWIRNITTGTDVLPPSSKESTMVLGDMRGDVPSSPDILSTTLDNGTRIEDSSNQTRPSNGVISPQEALSPSITSSSDSESYYSNFSTTNPVPRKNAKRRKKAMRKGTAEAPIAISESTLEEGDLGPPRMTRRSNRKRKASEKLIESISSTPTNTRYETPRLHPRHPMMQAAPPPREASHGHAQLPRVPENIRRSDQQRYIVINAKPNISHFVKFPRDGVQDTQRWQGGFLQKISLENVYKEVSEKVVGYSSKSKIQLIEFRLISKSNSFKTPRSFSFKIEREDTEMYEEAKQIFEKGIREDRRRGIWDHVILLEVEVEQEEDRADAGAAGEREESETVQF